MNLRGLSRIQRFILLALAIGDLVVLCLMGSAAGLSALRSRTGPPAAEVAAGPPTATAPVPGPISTAIPPSPTPTRPPYASPAPAPTNTRVVSRETYNQPIVDAIIEEVTFIRELETLAEVPFRMLDRQEMTGEMKALISTEELSRDLEEQWLLYDTMGLLTGTTSLNDQDLETVATQFSGLYVPEQKQIYVVTQRANMSAEEETVFAHEYTHALQDQHFNLSTYPLQHTNSTDADLAARALVEGDATVVMTLYAYENTTAAEWEYLAYQASFAEEPELEMEGLSEQASRIVAFPYFEGTTFVLALLLENVDFDWQAVNDAFSNPPQTTEQILHPEVYIAQRDFPEEITLPPAPGPAWQLAMEDTLGEFIISVHLEEFLTDEERSSTAAAGWDGDRIGVWQNGNQQSLVLWRIAWENAGEAAEFEEAYQALIPLRFPDAPPTGEGWWEQDGTNVRLGRDGNRVTVAWGPDRESVEAVTAAGW